MPIYEYQCTACGHRLEVLQKMSDTALVDCPACQQATLQRLVSSTSFQLKGTGWYVTDFRDKNKPEKTLTEPSNPTDNNSGDTTAANDANGDASQVGSGDNTSVSSEGSTSSNNSTVTS
jgi:putative FmdB family regulatory protein